MLAYPLPSLCAVSVRLTNLRHIEVSEYAEDPSTILKTAAPSNVDKRKKTFEFNFVALLQARSREKSICNCSDDSNSSKARLVNKVHPLVILVKSKYLLQLTILYHSVS